ncbi:pyridoxal-phosphate dependent enzyme [Urechidicola sp. KH5]
MLQPENSIIQPIILDEIFNINVDISIKRDDLIHPQISGNKYRKLKYNILKAGIEGKTTLLTFGGAFSNHIAAVAAVGKEYGLQTVGIIRGEELGLDLETTLASNTTLRYAHTCGMQFEFISRTDYRNKHEHSFLEIIEKKYPNTYIIPEGGTNDLAVKGCREILDDRTKGFDIICAPVGTGGTLSGLIEGANKYQKVLGFPALKGDFLSEEIKKFTTKTNWQLIGEYHFGGYAKTSEELITFINSFKRETVIPLDPIYTGKMMYGLVDMIKKGMFEEGTNILVIHTGGLQGIKGMNAILKKKNSLIIEE